MVVRICRKTHGFTRDWLAGCTSSAQSLLGFSHGRHEEFNAHVVVGTQYQGFANLRCFAACGRTGDDELNHIVRCTRGGNLSFVAI